MWLMPCCSGRERKYPQLGSKHSNLSGNAMCVFAVQLISFLVQRHVCLTELLWKYLTHLKAGLQISGASIREHCVWGGFNPQRGVNGFHFQAHFYSNNFLKTFFLNSHINRCVSFSFHSCLPLVPSCLRLQPYPDLCYMWPCPSLPQDKLQVLQWQLHNKLLYREQVLVATRPPSSPPFPCAALWVGCQLWSLRGYTWGAQLLFWVHLMVWANSGRIKKD